MLHFRNENLRSFAMIWSKVFLTPDSDWSIIFQWNVFLIVSVIGPSISNTHINYLYLNSELS